MSNSQDGQGAGGDSSERTAQWHFSRRQVLMQIALAAGSAVMGRAASAGTSEPSATAPSFKSKLGESQRLMVSQVAELIIPATDTPGAIAAGVPAFIDQIVSVWCTPKERMIFVSGLAALDAFCQARQGRAFSACDAQEQTLALADSEQRASHYRPSSGNIFNDTDEDAPFFYKLKQLTVLGYYTSEIGATQELRYEPVPNRYDGDLEFSKVGRQWSS
jgi:hypothetical protein